jgi:GntR family transcriptional regulator, arabinose operon transcriptional repressor
MQLRKDSPVPLYQQLLNEVRDRISTGEWKVGSRLPSETELASSLGVSRVTIRQALGAAVEAGLLVRARGKGTFVAPAAAVEPQRGFVGHVIPFLSHNFNVRILLGIESILKMEGFRLSFANSEGDIYTQHHLLDSLAAEGMVGCILEPTHGEDHVLETWVARHYPVVLLDRAPAGLSADLVASDHFSGGYAAVQHLIEQGYTDIAYLTAQPIQLSSIMERMAAYQTAMEDAGLPPRPPLVLDGARERGFFQSPASFVQQEARAISQITRWLRGEDRPRAIVALNDLLALLVLEAARRVELRVPDDLALVGFDDVDFAATTDPPLTTVAQPAYQLGVEAARLLLKRVRGDTSPAQHIRLPTELIVRESTVKSRQEQHPVSLLRSLSSG